MKVSNVKKMIEQAEMRKHTEIIFIADKVGYSRKLGDKYWEEIIL